MTDRLPTDTTHDDVLAVTRILDDLPAPWFVCGGWAIDLFLGEVTRAHADLEIGIARADQEAIKPALSDWTLYTFEPVPGQDANILPWTDDEYLNPPIHQVLCRKQEAKPTEFEFFLNEVAEGIWRFRRMEHITRPLEEVRISSDAGVPIVAPEIQLLYKAAHHRPKDEADFESVARRLDDSRRLWLLESLRQYRPEDPWINRLLAC